MDYVLYVVASAAFAAVYAAVWTLGGQRAKLVLSLGAYAFHPRYVPPSRSWRQATIGHRGHRASADHFPSWHQYFADAADAHAREIAAAEGLPPDVTLAYDTTPLTPGIDSAPTVTLPTYWDPQGNAHETGRTPRLVRAEQSLEEYGAEHWGGLLAEMNTEERAVYSAELVQVYEETKAPERAFLDGLDAAIDSFTAAMDRLDRRTEAAFVGVGVNLARKHGGSDRWSTGQFPIYEPAAA